MPKRIALAGLVALALAGCQCGGERERAPSSEGSSGETLGSQIAAAGPTGFVEGVVRLAEGAEVPSYPQNPLVVEGRNPIPDECTPPREADRTPVVVADETGGLVNLSIVATGQDESRWPRAHEPVTHEVTIRDCRITPPLLVTTRGDRVRLSNQTDYPFFPELGEGVLQALLRQEPREITLDQGGVRTIQCGFAAPCGRMELVTLYHPVHTVTPESGRFRLEVPANEEVRITAWHPLFEETSTTTEVEPGQTREVELTIRPAAIRAPQPPPMPGPDGPIELDPDPNVPF